MKWILILMVFGPGSGNVSNVGEFRSEADCAHAAVLVSVRAIETAEKVPVQYGQTTQKVWSVHAICQSVRTEPVKAAPPAASARRTS